jgi:hypothetical protein
MKSSGWETLGNVSPRQLAPARLLLHHAAQVVAAAARSLCPPRPDDGHTSLEWTSPHGLTGQEVPGKRPWRASLRLDEASLEVLAEGTEVGRYALQGRTQRAAFEWLVARARELGAPVERLALVPPYALPEHPFGAGAVFEAPGDGSLAEVARWFGNADTLLREIADAWPGAAPVRVWPHHFDIGSVLPLASGHGEEAPSIGIGLSPGDEGIAEPYFYVTPWPAPGAAEPLPELEAGGRWHREGWTGAVLEASEVVAAGGGAAQAAAASAFLEGAVDVLRARHARRGA